MLQAPGAKSSGKPLTRIISDAVRPVPAAESLPRTTAAWLNVEENGLVHLLPILGGQDLAQLCSTCKSDRVRFLAELKSLGVAKLGDRQKVANALGRDRREGRIWLPGEEPPASTKAASREPPIAPAIDFPPATIANASSSSSSSSSSAMPTQPSRRDANAAALEADPVMAALKARRAARAWQLARELRPSPAASVLRARALVGMGSLASAMALYREAMTACGDDDGQVVLAADTMQMAALAKAEAAQLFGLAQFHDALGVALRFVVRRLDR